MLRPFLRHFDPSRPLLTLLKLQKDGTAEVHFASHRLPVACYQPHSLFVHGEFLLDASYFRLRDASRPTAAPLRRTLSGRNERTGSKGSQTPRSMVRKSRTAIEAQAPPAIAAEEARTWLIRSYFLGRVPNAAWLILQASWLIE
jgi:hypothetical protein